MTDTIMRKLNGCGNKYLNNLILDMINKIILIKGIIYNNLIYNLKNTFMF